MFRPGYQALIVAAEYAVTVSSDDVVHAVQDRGRQNAQEPRRLPRPPQFAGDEEHGAARAQYAGARRSIVHDHAERAHFVGVAAISRDHRASAWTLERRERKHGTVIVFQEELDRPIAQSADAVVEHEVRRLGVRMLLWGCTDLDHGFVVFQDNRRAPAQADGRLQQRPCSARRTGSSGSVRACRPATVWRVETRGLRPRAGSGRRDRSALLPIPVRRRDHERWPKSPDAGY